MDQDPRAGFGGDLGGEADVVRVGVREEDLPDIGRPNADRAEVRSQLPPGAIGFLAAVDQPDTIVPEHHVDIHVAVAVGQREAVDVIGDGLAKGDVAFGGGVRSQDRLNIGGPQTERFRIILYPNVIVRRRPSCSNRGGKLQ